MFGFVLALAILLSILEGNIQQAYALLALQLPTMEAIIRLFTKVTPKQKEAPASLSPREKRRSRRQRTADGEKRRWRKGMRLPR